MAEPEQRARLQKWPNEDLETVIVAVILASGSLDDGVEDLA
jgi:hypothetical protein